jgi:predicted cobalt transporter CbtA
MGTLLVRGMIVGLLAAALALGFAEIFGEPEVGRAISFEETQAAAEHAGHDATAGGHSHGAGGEELVSRDVQSTIGLATAVGIYGVAFGGLFALAFAFAYGRIGNLSARATAAVLGFGSFVVVFLVPYLKYPANPPAAGQSQSVGDRTLWYVSMVVLSIVFAVVMTVVARRLAGRLGAWNAVLLGVLGYLVLITVAVLLLPAVNELPDTFPPRVLWNFRLASLGTQLVLWAGIGLLFGAVTERSLRRVVARAV